MPTPSLTINDQLGVPRVQFLELMVVNHRQPEEPANPYPVSRRVEFRHAERRLHAVGQVETPVDCGPSSPGGVAQSV